MIYPSQLRDILVCDKNMKPVNFTECVSVAAVPPYDETSVTAKCDFEAKKRYNKRVELQGPSWSPIHYRDRVICYMESTRRRFISRVDYEPHVRPRSFADTIFVFPKNIDKRYVSTYTSHGDGTRKWFKTAVEFDGPKGPLRSTWNGSAANGSEGSADESDEYSPEEADDSYNYYTRGGLVNGYSEDKYMNGRLNGSTSDSDSEVSL